MDHAAAASVSPNSSDLGDTVVVESIELSDTVSADHDRTEIFSASRTASNGFNLWSLYQQWVNDPLKRVALELADDVVSRLLWWFPHRNADSVGDTESSSFPSRWREVVWGLLELQRLAVDVAMYSSTKEIDNGTNDIYSYGATVAIRGSYTEQLWNRRIRVALSALQCISPIAQELVRSSDRNATSHRQVRVRLVVEQSRCVLRLILLYRYWRKMKADGAHLLPGLIQKGGMFHTPPVPTIQEECSRLQRLHYVGTRTGRRVISKSEAIANPGVHHKIGHCSQRDKSKALIGELLYIFRPLFWAQAESNNVDRVGSLWNAWLLSLGADILSLVALYNCYDSGNKATHEERERRRLRLFLYVLRSPIWERGTTIGVTRVNKVVECVPLLGKVVSAYLQDWISYWKLYRAEEG
jgi:hypothetical protein